MINHPPCPTESTEIIAKKFVNGNFPTLKLVLEGVCKFAAIELSAQPKIRSLMKAHINQHGTITTSLTEQGKKDLDLFHHSYRVKTVRNMPLSELRSRNDIFLDILQCEKAGLITVNIAVNEEEHDKLKT